MSDTSSLSELARFVGSSALNADDIRVRQQTINGIARRLQPRARRSVTELLGAVMALSARTRRMLMAPVGVDLDVFSPNGNRAVRIRLPGHQ
jgi:hypothetical protein